MYNNNVVYWYSCVDLCGKKKCLPISSFFLADQVCYEVSEKVQGIQICDEKGQGVLLNKYIQL